MEKGLFIPHFLGGNINTFGNITKNGCIYIAILRNISKNGYVAKMTSVPDGRAALCPTLFQASNNTSIENLLISYHFKWGGLISWIFACVWRGHFLWISRNLSKVAVQTAQNEKFRTKFLVSCTLNGHF